MDGRGRGRGRGGGRGQARGRGGGFVSRGRGRGRGGSGWEHGGGDGFSSSRGRGRGRGGGRGRGRGRGAERGFGGDDAAVPRRKNKKAATKNPETLEARGGKLVDLSSIEASTDVRKADLRDNELKRLKGVSTLLPRLTMVNAGNNHLHSKALKDVAGLTELRVLNMAGNRIKRFPPGCLPSSLQALILNNNSIEVVDNLAHCTALNTLVLSHNAIATLRSFPLASLAHLAKVSLPHNKLTQFPDLSANPALAELRLNDNNISSIPETVLKIPKLRLLDVGNNKIASWKAVKPLEACARLLNLNLNGNPLASSSTYAARIDKRFPYLTVVDYVKRASKPPLRAAAVSGSSGDSDSDASGADGSDDGPDSSSGEGSDEPAAGAGAGAGDEGEEEEEPRSRSMADLLRRATAGFDDGDESSSDDEGHVELAMPRAGGSEEEDAVGESSDGSASSGDELEAVAPRPPPATSARTGVVAVLPGKTKKRSTVGGGAAPRGKKTKTVDVKGFFDAPAPDLGGWD